MVIIIPGLSEYAIGFLSGSFFNSALVIYCALNIYGLYLHSFPQHWSFESFYPRYIFKLIRLLLIHRGLPDAIHATADFGAGYTPDGSSSIYTGQLVIDLTRIVMSETGPSANATLVSTNLRRDGKLILDGSMTMDIRLDRSGNDALILGTLHYSNLYALDAFITGETGLSMSPRMFTMLN